MASTPAVTVAERAGIDFVLHEYEHDAAATSYGIEAAEKLGVDPTHLDVSARDLERMLVSAGRRGLQIELSPDDFVRLTDARVHPIGATI
jgi:prolyl-tRNA editing enzyme YbaK/EbsC (Cys-tRNA(Pro) deacylase)